MATSTITGKTLLQLGFPEGKEVGLALEILKTHYKGKSQQFKLDLMRRVLEAPAMYRDHDILKSVAEAFLTKREDIILREHRMPYAIYGAEGIEGGAIHQMEVAMKLPITRAGALMPDAHHGYGLPIGGVLATENAVIPYGVGVDIGCRMCLSMYDLPVDFNRERTDLLKRLLLHNTQFGYAVFKDARDHEVLSHQAFDEIDILKSLKERACRQIGSSGGGNHFVEFGTVDLTDEHNEFGLPHGKYLAVLSHSGSRGLGAGIAQHYTKVAKAKCTLPKEAQHLAWLTLDSDEGREYWMAMQLAGDYASACHHQIHDRLSEALGEKPLAMVENHHNFAWKEQDENGREWIVHRKGATPAGKGMLGIIPGSMTSPGFIVRGRGAHASIQSASHGAGRVMSRRKAKETLSKEAVKNHLKEAGIALMGSGLDEAPMVYKDIHQVMAAQEALVEVVGSFTPKVVRMCGDHAFLERD